MTELTPTEHLERITRQREHCATLRDQVNDLKERLKDATKRLDVALTELDRVIENPQEDEPELPYEQTPEGK